jgi:hypothetical protein
MIIDDMENLLKILGEKEFQKAYQQIDSLALNNCKIHIKIAAKFEEFGDSRSALKEYNLAVRDGCDDPAIYEKMAEYYSDLGKARNAIHFLELLLEKKPENFDAATKLGSIYEELELLDKSRELYTRLLAKTGDQRYQNQLKEIENTYFVKAETEEIDGGPMTDEVLLKFVDLFSGREGAYARQWVNEKGESGYAPVREHFTPAVAKNHLLGNHTVGVYQLRVNASVNWMAVDIDIDKKHREKMEKGEVSEEIMLSLAFQKAREVFIEFEDLAIPAYIEFSGFKGYHVWAFFDDPIPAFHARAFLLRLLQTHVIPDKKINIEIFPKQVKVKDNGLGNLIKLPLGLHRKTGKLAFFVDECGKKISDQWGFIKEIKKTSRDNFYQSSAHLKRKLPAKTDLAVTDATTPAAAANLTEKKAFDPFTSAAFNFLTSKCEVLSHIVDQLHKTRTLGNDEKIILKFTLGNLDEGVELVNHLFGLLPDVKESELLKSKLAGNPISCPRIRKRLPQQTKYLKCSCDFGECGIYPNPLLHLKELYKSETGPLRRQEAHAIRFQNALQQYLKIKNEINERQLSLKEIEKYFHAYFDEQGLDEIATSIGVIKRVFHPNGTNEFIIRI